MYQDREDQFARDFVALMDETRVMYQGTAGGVPELPSVGATEMAIKSLLGRHVMLQGK